MTKFIDEELNITKECRWQKADRAGYVDIHCHCLPAIDDGPNTKYEALALCQLLVDDGVNADRVCPMDVAFSKGVQPILEIENLAT